MGNDTIVGSVPATTTDPTSPGAAQTAATTVDPQSQASQDPQIVNDGSAAVAQPPGATQAAKPAGAGAPTPATDPSGNGQTSKTGSSEMGSSLETIWSWLKPSAWAVAGAVLFMAFVFGVIRPQDGTSDPIGENAALAWNTTIQRLGIQPLYPPQEDFYVGDVFLTVSPAPEIADKVTDYPTNVFEGKAIKVGRIPIQLASLAAERFRYEKQYPDNEQKSGKTNPTMLTLRKPILPSPDAVPLSMVSFPGITINQTLGADAGWKDVWFGRSTTALEMVSIPAAETYAMPTIEALLALRQFCIDIKTALYCRDADARKILQYTLGERVNAVVGGKYAFQLNILVTTQVYLTDQFDISRTNSDGLQASLGKPAASNSPAPKPPEAGADPAADEPEKEADAARPALPAESRAVNGSYHDEQKSTQDFKRKFDRPVAFGFKSVVFVLPSSQPAGHKAR